MLPRKVLSLAAALVFLSTSGLAVAQDATTPPPAAPPAAEPAPATPPPAPAEPAPAEVVVGDQPAAATPTSPDEKTEEILVTGSRIRRKDLTTPAPVTVIAREQFMSSGKISLGDFLQSLPEQGNALNIQVNNNSGDSAGAVHVDLRSLGANRTLVLVNGRRFVPGDLDPEFNSPDLNSIPAAAIERIEVLKDGASAVYGSDAVSGVVNVILKKRFAGTEVSGYAGVSSEGDGEIYDLSAVTGATSDRGNILFSVGYQEQSSLLAKDRKWAETTYDYDFSTGALSATGNSSTFPAGRFAIPGDPAATCAGATGPLADICTQWAASDPNPDDRVTDFVPVGGGLYEPYDGSLYNTNPTNYLITPSRRIQLFATGDTNIGDVARGFFEASYVNRNSSQNLAPMPLVNNTIPTAPVTLSADSIYNPFGVDLTSWRRRVVEFGERRWSMERDTFRVVLGVDGTLGDWAGGFLSGWNWELAYNWGRGAGTQESTGQLRMPNVANAVGPSFDPDGILGNGDEVCVRNVGTNGVPDATDPVIPGCVPMNVLGGVGTLNPAAAQYVTFAGTLRAESKQQVWSANTAGELFTLPTSDRPVGLALGVEHRREEGTFTPDPITASLESSGNNQLPTKGDYNVTEGYAELSVPILSGIPWAHNLEATGAVRLFDYSTFGSDNTYKFGARYSPFRDVTLRGTYSTAFRAPNIPELFGGTADSFEFLTDPCNPPDATEEPDAFAEWDAQIRPLCLADGVPGGNSGDPSIQFLQKRIANPDLEPETADIWTAGVVLEPRWVRNLSLTVDYYNIAIDNWIGIRGASFIVDRCYDPSGRDLAMCALIDRDPVTGEILQINDIRSNVYKFETSGLDFAARYALPTGFGRFNFIVDATYLLDYTQIDETGFETDGSGNYDLFLVLPKFKTNVGVLWSMGNFGAGVATRYIGGYEECGSGNCTTDDEDSRRVESYMPFDIYASYRLKTAGTTTINVGMLNVADLKPPYVYNSSEANTDGTMYDFLGRYVYARLTHNF